MLHTLLNLQTDNVKADVIERLTENLSQTLGKQVQITPEYLGVIYGFAPIEIDDEAVAEEAKLRHGDPDLAVAPYEVIEEVLWEVVQEKCAELGLVGVTKDDVSGKSGRGWVKTLLSVIFDLDDAAWRLGDFLRPAVTPFERHIKPSDVTCLTTKKVLGDGVVAAVRPEVLGLEPGTIDFYQVRAFHHSGPDQVNRLFKGLVVVHPKAYNVIAWADGYGKKGATFSGELRVFHMVRGSDYNPRSGYNDQGVQYNALETEWWNSYYSMPDLTSINVPGLQRGAKLLAANAPVHALGGLDTASTMGALFSRNAASGRAKMVLPACVFDYIGGLEHISQIESFNTYLDKTGRAYMALDGDKKPFDYIPPFYAPASERRYFQKAGGIGTRWAMNRGPDMPTGQCTVEGELVGFNPFNAFVIPSASMDIAGCDFDGDIVRMLPTIERGGHYTCFNRRSYTEQTFIMAQSVVRTSTKGKYFYETPLQRWAGQLEARVILGMADVYARKFVDAGLRVQAYQFARWIQAAVDRQKRPDPLPDPLGLSAMPKPANIKGAVYLTDVLRKISKGDNVDHLDGAYRKGWAQFQNKLDALEVLASLGAHADTCIIAQNSQIKHIVVRWAGELAWRLRAVSNHQVRRYRYRDGRPVFVGGVKVLEETPIPHNVSFPRRRRDVAPALHPKAEELLKPIISLTLELDAQYADTLASNREQRAKVYAIKDGLVETVQYIDREFPEMIFGEYLAGQCESYDMFRELATAEQLREYFGSHLFENAQGVPIPRIRELFDVVDGSKFAVSAGSLTNTQSMHVGFTHYKPGDLKISKQDGVAIVTTPRGSFRARSLHLSDVLGEAHAVENERIYGSRETARELFGKLSESTKIQPGTPAVVRAPELPYDDYVPSDDVPDEYPEYVEPDEDLPIVWTDDDLRGAKRTA